MIDIAALYTEHAQHVRNLLRRRLPYADPAALDDLVHDVFVRALRHQAQYREQGKPLSWLLTIAAHLATDHVRAAARRMDVPVDAWHAIVSDAGNDRHADAIDVQAAVSALPESQQTFIWRVYRDDVPYYVAAGCEPHHGRQTRVHRAAMTALRALMGAPR